MSSINTNAGAMTALQTLKATNKNLETTQGRISTGARVSEAAHNAAYWSIATTMRSDNKAMSTVRDALGLGAAQVDIAYTAMDAVKDTLDTMKSKLVAAQQPDIDLEKIQEEINQLQNDLKTYAKSATFSGGNWLDVDAKSEQKVVASFVREGSAVKLETITVDTAKTALFTQGTDAASKGILQQGFTELVERADVSALTAVDTPGSDETAPNAGDGTPGTSELSGFDTLVLEEGGVVSFTVAVNGGDAVTVELTRGAEDWTEADFQKALSDAGVSGVTVAFTSGKLTLTNEEEGAAKTVTIDDLAIKDVAVNENVTVTNFKINEKSREELGRYLTDVENALKAVTTAASDLGAIKTRISSQSDFVGKIMDAVDRGVGQLVDADMEQESSRLQALQVQQQLGIQALSIANSNTQNILSLFR